MVTALRRTGGMMRPALRPWRLAILLVVVIGLAVASAVHLHSGNGGKGTALTGSGTSGQNGANNGALPGTGSNSGSSSGTGNGSGNGAGANGASGQGGQSGGAHGTPTPSAYPGQTPSDSVFGHAELLQSNCAAGYEPGTQCTVYYHGVYELISKPAGKLVLETIIDGTVVAGFDYVAPPGGHQFGNNMKFTVPPHAKKIVYKSLLEDANGKVIASSPDQVTYGYG